MEPRVLQHEVNGEGEPIVLVPGGLTGWLSWIPHAEALAASRRVVRVQPVHNEIGSRGEIPDADYDVIVEREGLRVTLEHLGIEVADFAGWSGGGRALVEFAIEYPERVRTLTLVEPPAVWVAQQRGVDTSELDDEMGLLRRTARRTVTEDDLAEFLEVAGFVSRDQARAHPRWPDWLPHRQALAAQWQISDSTRALADLARITAPTLLVKGMESTPLMRSIVDLLGEELPNARVLDLPGTHACHLESPERFLAELQTHLQAAPARS